MEELPCWDTFIISGGDIGRSSSFGSFEGGYSVTYNCSSKVQLMKCGLKAREDGKILRHAPLMKSLIYGPESAKMYIRCRIRISFFFIKKICIIQRMIPCTF